MSRPLHRVSRRQGNQQDSLRSNRLRCLAGSPRSSLVDSLHVSQQVNPVVSPRCSLVLSRRVSPPCSPQDNLLTSRPCSQVVNRRRSPLGNRVSNRRCSLVVNQQVNRRRSPPGSLLASQPHNLLDSRQDSQVDSRRRSLVANRQCNQQVRLLVNRQGSLPLNLRCDRLFLFLQATPRLVPQSCRVLLPRLYPELRTSPPAIPLPSLPLRLLGMLTRLSISGTWRRRPSSRLMRIMQFL